jgi:hypothetical protein
MAFPVSKALQAACLRDNTYGAGVVTEAHNPIVVAQKNPHVLLIYVTTFLSLLSCRLPDFYGGFLGEVLNGVFLDKKH